MSEAACDERRRPDLAVRSPRRWSDPYPAYKTLRDTSPVHFEPNFGAWVVTRYDLVREALARHRDLLERVRGFPRARPRRSPSVARRLKFSGKLIALNKRMVPLPPTMLTLDEPGHTKYRSLVSQLFTGSQVKRGEAYRPPGDRRGHRAPRIAAPDTDGGGAGADFVTEFGLPVPLRIIADRLGIPEREREFFNEAAAAAADALKLTPLTPEEMVHRARLAVDLQELLVSLVDARRETPSNDMIGLLANATLEAEGRTLTHGEILSILNQFLVAGHETTSSAFGWGMLLLCRHPVLQEELQGDAERLRTFVEETLRVEAPVQGLPRLVTRPTKLGDMRLEAGNLVMLRFGAANRDEREFEHPDTVDVHRKKAGRQLAFGSGIHHCIGAPLARQELRLGFGALLDAFVGFRLAEGPKPAAEPSFILRNLPRLVVACRRRASPPE